MARVLTTLCAAAAASVVTIAAQTASSLGTATQSEDRTATAALKDAAGNVVGRASLRETANGVLLGVNFTGIPSGAHAFHIHEHGKCDAPDFESAGGHLALTGVEHGFLDEWGPHAGDLPNIHVPDGKRLSMEAIVSAVTLGPGEQSLLDGDGSALVVHEDPDDYHSEPAGGSGKRIACGVITTA